MSTIQETNAAKDLENLVNDLIYRSPETVTSNQTVEKITLVYKKSQEENDPQTQNQCENILSYIKVKIVMNPDQN